MFFGSDSFFFGSRRCYLFVCLMTSEIGGSMFECNYLPTELAVYCDAGLGWVKWRMDAGNVEKFDSIDSLKCSWLLRKLCN